MASLLAGQVRRDLRKHAPGLRQAWVGNLNEADTVRRSSLVLADVAAAVT
jgi:hypothetical protein